MRRLLRPLRAVLGVASLVVLAACGGGGDADTPPPAAACDTVSQQQWLRAYMRDWYFWYASSPNPDPAGYATVDAYFNALLYGGADPAFPDADRWSFSESTVSHDRFYGDGQTLGYGVFVAGMEVQGRPDLPLLVRYIEPESPAAKAGVVRGDRILSINGVAAADVITADDYAALTPAAEGERITLGLRNTGGDRTVTLTAAVFTLTPVAQASVIDTAAGRKMGYVLVKDMLRQARAPLDAAFAQFRAAGVQDVVLDLRYNGGGLVSVSADLASQVAGGRAAGQPFATLLYNDKRAANNETMRFTSPPNALGLSRVYVLAGPRTCSASEQVVNGLRPFVDIVLVGDVTCGKPVGFLPADSCGVTYNAVNFESVNARNEGRYFDGFAPSAGCDVAENFTQALGSPSESLLAAARLHADTGACSATGMREKPMALRAKPQRLKEPGEHPAMIPR